MESGSKYNVRVMWRVMKTELLFYIGPSEETSLIRCKGIRGRVFGGTKNIKITDSVVEFTCVFYEQQGGQHGLFAEQYVHGE